MLWRTGLAALVVSLTLNGGLLWERMTKAHGTAVDIESTTHVPPSGTPRNGPVPRTDYSPASAPECRKKVEALQGEIERAATELRRVMPADRLFRLGAPNEPARARMAPVLARLMGSDAGPPPEHTVECRDYVCKVSVLDTEGGPSPDRWMLPLQSPEMRLYTHHGVQFTGGGFVKDPVSGEGLRRSEAFIKLANPDGTPISSEPARDR
jgi:hypothetical protein